MACISSDPSDLYDVLAGRPRLTGLALAPSGDRLIASVQVINGEGNAFVPGLWEVDPAGEREARRVTRSLQGEYAPAFAPDGRLMFLSSRENTDPFTRTSSDSTGPGLWSLPEYGEAERIVHHPSGISAFTVAHGAGTVAYTASVLPGAADTAAHAEFREKRESAKITAVLYDSGPTRFGGADLGPAEPHTFVLRPDGTQADVGGQGVVGGGDLALSPDGTLVAYTRAVAGSEPDVNANVVVVADAATGEVRRIFSRPGHHYHRLVFTADGRSLVSQRQRELTYDTPWRVTLVAFDPASGAETDLLPDFDNWPWPGSPVVSPVPGDATVWFTGDERGHCPVFRRGPDGTVTRLTSSGAYSSLCVALDGTTLFALRSTIDSPPHVVRLDAAAPDQQPVTLWAPADPGPLPGTLTEVHTTADDGFPLRAWLVLPRDASAERPAPLVVLPHGGPQMSWSGWTFGFGPWPFAARGYAVLLPDPALSTGYGQRMQERGLGQYGGRPYRDLMLADATQTRDDIDATRTGLAGHSYGGYIANRAATLTDRFKAIVTYGGQWNLESFQAETDLHAHARRIFGDPLTQRQRYETDSPHLDVRKAMTPMLVVHGGKDYRVPVGQALGLFNDLQRHEVPVKFLYFPDESHSVGAPNHVRILYETVLNFLDHHVLGQEWHRPQLL
ncbi:alpha/beta fold hydrolase [Streptomyces sp. NPDC058676]|uniref:S9 family peptidase n=1 Tax=unclassified Streptomyces TaxID=2593676 RepID=UPI00364FA6D7